MYATRVGALSLAALLVACGSKSTTPTPAAVAPSVGRAAVNAARITAADSEPGNWMSYGRTYDEQRFSPLKQINAQNVTGLHLAWHYDLDAAHRVQESTPIVVDVSCISRPHGARSSRSIQLPVRSSGFSIRRYQALLASRVVAM